jgi:hypothetical protein
MNFQDLLSKMKQLDECGEMPGTMHSPKQQDNVNMNVTMSGNGAGGIKDLMNILKNIETGATSHGDEPPGDDTVVIGSNDIADVQAELDDSYNNEPNTEVAGIDAVTPTGNDLASKGDEAEKANGGGNPWKQTEVSEALIQQLSSHYQSVKNS